MTTNFDYYEDGDVLTGSQLNNQISRSLMIALQSAFQLNVELSTYSEGSSYEGFDNSIIQNFVSADPVIKSQRCSRDASYYMVGDDTTDMYYMIVTATSCTRSDGYTSSSVTVNQLSSTQWLIYTTAGTAEENRSRLLYMTGYDTAALFLGTIFTGITSVEVSDSREVGKTLNYMAFRVGLSTSSTGNFILTGTPTATTGNNDCHVMYEISETSNSIGNAYNTLSERGSRLYGPNGVVAVPRTIDNRFADTSSLDFNNPTNVVYLADGTNMIAAYPSTTIQHDAVVSSLPLTFVENYTGSDTPSTNRHGNLYDDYSVPLFTAVTTSFDPDSWVIETGFTSTVTAEGVWNDYVSILDAGASVSLEASADGTNYETVTKSEFKKLTNLGTTIRFKMTVTKSSSTDTTSRVYGMACGI